MTSTNVTHAQLVEAVRAYRSYGSKIRAEVKAGKPDLFIDRNRRFQKVLVGKLAEAGHMDLVLALADEQVGLDGIAFAKALYPSHEAKSREVLRNARRRIKVMIEGIAAAEAQAVIVKSMTDAEAIGHAVAVTERNRASLTGDWYLIPAEGERLNDRHDVLGPYATKDLAEHLRETYADAGIAGMVVQSITRPTPAPREVVPSALHMRRKGSLRVYRVLGTELTGVWLQAVADPSNPIIRYGRELIENGWVACDAQGYVHEHDVSIMTLVELVRFRRMCAVIFRSPTRLEDSSYVFAARYTEEIDQELLLREQTGLRAALITEASHTVAIEHGERHGYEVPLFVADELDEVRTGIDAHLTHSGHLVRD